jgi:hypothetical protein
VAGSEVGDWAKEKAESNKQQAESSRWILGIFIIKKLVHKNIFFQNTFKCASLITIIKHQNESLCFFKLPICFGKFFV